MRLFLLCITLFLSCKDLDTSTTLSMLYAPNQSQSHLFAKDEFEEMAKKYNDYLLQLKRKPKDITTWTSMFDVYLFANRVTGDHQYVETIDAISTQLLLLPSLKANDKFKIMSYKATAQLGLHEFEKALTTATEASTLMPANAAILGAAVDASVELGYYDRAIELVDKMMQLRPDLRSYSRVSYLRELHGDVDGAIDAMSEAVKSGIEGDEQTEWCRVHLGKLYASKGKIDFAKMHFMIAIENRPQYLPALIQLALLNANHNDITSAEKLLAQLPAHIALQEAKAEISLLKKDKTALDDNYEKIMQNLDQHGNANPNQKKSKYIVTSKLKSEQEQHVLKQIALEKAKLMIDLKKDFDGALPYLQFEYGIRPNNIEVNKYLAMAYASTHNLDKAIFHLNKALATQWRDKELLTLDAVINKKSLAEVY